MASRFRSLRRDLPAALALALGFTCVSNGQFDFPGGGPSDQQPLSADRLVEVQVVADRDNVAPGETFDLAIVFKIQPRWHIYWKNPGEGAAAPNIRVNGPDGFEIGEVRYPRPKVVESPIGDMFCHDGSSVLFVPVTAPTTLDEGTASFTTEVGFAVCDSRQCFFGRKSHAVTVNTLRERGNVEQIIKTFQPARDLLPIVIDNNDEDGKAIVKVRGDGETRTLTISGPAHGFTEARFFHFDSPGVNYGDPDFTFENDRFTVVIKLNINEGNFASGPPAVGGLVGLGKKIDDPAYEAAISLSGDDANSTDS